MISTSFITGTGFIKCIPITIPGLLVTAAIFVMDIEEVFDKILLSAKIEEAKRQIANGEVVDWEDVKKEMDTW